MSSTPRSHPPVKLTVTVLAGRVHPVVTSCRDPVVTARVSGSTPTVPLVPGDVIRSLNTTPMTTLERLRAALKTIGPGGAVVLQVQREGKLIYVPFTLE